MRVENQSQRFVFIGWFRANSRKKWRPIVEGDSHADTLGKLLSEPPGDKIVLPAGRNPNERGCKA